MSQELTLRGWTPIDSEGPIFILRESVEVEFQFAPRMSKLSSGILLLPALGVRHPETSRLVTKFYGLVADNVGVCSFGRGLAHLMSRYGHISDITTRWLVLDSTSVDSVVETLCVDLESYGLPFFREFRTLDDVIHRFEQESLDQFLLGHLGVSYALRNSLRQAIDALGRYANIASTQQPPLSTQSWRFVRSFIDHFSIREDSLPFEIGD